MKHYTFEEWVKLYYPDFDPDGKFYEDCPICCGDGFQDSEDFGNSLETCTACEGHGSKYVYDLKQKYETQILKDRGTEGLPLFKQEVRS